MITLLEKIFSNILVPAADSILNNSIKDVIGNKTDVANAAVGTASLVGLARNNITTLQGIQGGSETLQSVSDKLDDFIDILRSGQSGSYTPVVPAAPADAVELTIYERTPTVGDVETIISCRINITTLAAGDELIIRRYIKNVSGGSYVLNSIDAAYTYSGVQTVGMIDIFQETYNTYGCKFVILQPTGTARAFVCEIIDTASGA